jgi:hypothetical protein
MAVYPPPPPTFTIYGLGLKDLMTLGIAVYGAVVSTLFATLGFRQSVKKEQKQVMLTWTLSVSFDARDNSLAQLTTIYIINRGQRPVMVDYPKFRMPNKRFMFLVPGQGYDQFPKRLEDGEKVSLDLFDEEIKKALRAAGYSGKVKLIPHCEDQEGNQYWGREKLVFDVTDPDAKKAPGI